jgi:hypothetical protein
MSLSSTHDYEVMVAMVTACSTPFSSPCILSSPLLQCFLSLGQGDIMCPWGLSSQLSAILRSLCDHVSQHATLFTAKKITSQKTQSLSSLLTMVHYVLIILHCYKKKKKTVPHTLERSQILMLVLGLELRSSERTICTLNH